MNAILIVGILSGALGNSSTDSHTNMYPDAKACTAAALKALEDNANKPGVISVTATCTVSNSGDAIKSLTGPGSH